MLVDVTVNSNRIKALAEVTKQAFRDRSQQGRVAVVGSEP
jgi:hypothetical protein